MATAVIGGIVVTGTPEEISKMITIHNTKMTVSTSVGIGRLGR